VHSKADLKASLSYHTVPETEKIMEEN